MRESLPKKITPTPESFCLDCGALFGSATIVCPRCTSIHLERFPERIKTELKDESAKEQFSLVSTQEFDGYWTASEVLKDEDLPPITTIAEGDSIDLILRKIVPFLIFLVVTLCCLKCLIH